MGQSLTHLLVNLPREHDAKGALFSAVFYSSNVLEIATKYLIHAIFALAGALEEIMQWISWCLRKQK